MVCSLRDAGLSVRAIAAATGAGYGTVQAELAPGDQFRSPDLEPADGDAIAAQPVAAAPAPTTTLAVVVAGAAAPGDRGCRDPFRWRHRNHGGHLTAGQRAAIALEALPLLEEEGRRKMARAVAERHRWEAEQRRVNNETVTVGVADRPHLDGHLTAGESAAIALESLPISEQSQSNDTPPTDPNCQGGADRPHPDNREKPKQRAPRSRDIAARSASAKRRSSSVARHIVSVRRSIISISRDRPSPATTVLSTVVAHDLLRRFLARLSGSTPSESHRESGLQPFSGDPRRPALACAVIITARELPGRHRWPGTQSWWVAGRLALPVLRESAYRCGVSHCAAA
ncbi:hypothetical protein JMUB5695_03123 [Mycobacterium heckeshornense]|nr:hypothetical protein JMUB5695_03123 [Mycobacterium heckeshornense]